MEAAGTPIPIISAKKFSDSFVMNHNSTLVIIPVGAIFPSLTERYYPFLRWRLLFDVECHFLSAHLILFSAVSLHLTSVLCMKLCHN